MKEQKNEIITDFKNSVNKKKIEELDNEQINKIWEILQKIK